MKKPWLLILAAIILVTLIGIWLYLFFGGEEAREDLYNTFGLTGDELPFDLENIFTDETATSTQANLRQLSLRQVAGYLPMDESSTTAATVRFVEMGTGHIYSVRVDDGSEERLSNITVPAARNATFSPDGQQAAITTDGGTSFTLVTLANGSTTLTSTNIPAAVISTTFTKDSTLLYATKEGQSVRGYTYDFATGNSNPLFTIPFREAVVLWGETEAGPHYTYPKTAEELEGYVYEINGTTLTRLPISGFGLSVIKSEDRFIYSKIIDQKMSSFISENGQTYQMSTPFIPEKCTSRGDALLCGIDEGQSPLSTWYRGEYMSNDNLWYAIPEINYLNPILNIGEITQRSIDMVGLSVTDRALYFVHRADNSLWVYDSDFSKSILDN
jgi:hypothetical protein